MSSPVDRDNALVGAVDGLPAFVCRVIEGGAWAFTCTCGGEHVHTSREGRRAGHCEQHRARGYYLLPPEDDGADQ